jgi:hypothetical protein
MGLLLKWHRIAVTLFSLTVLFHWSVVHVGIGENRVYASRNGEKL